jgi:predicted hotdog family 3-hydroxylacyl-ACP dehydratase
MPRTSRAALPRLAPAIRLARDGVVPAIAAVEYARQAAAVHGALLESGRTPRRACSPS